MSEQRVTLVTRNQQHALTKTLVELAVYGVVLYLIVNPEKIGQTQDALNRWRDRLAHRISIWQTRHAIRSLPEFPDLDR